jgi:hypothetical protein
MKLYLKRIWPPPSWFAAQGISYGSKWCKFEIETLAWLYVIMQARDGDTWHEIAPEKCYNLLTSDECNAYQKFFLKESLHHVYYELWKMIGDQLYDANGAFAVGGSTWARHRFTHNSLRDNNVIRS